MAGAGVAAPLVGRTREEAALQDALARARGGRGGVLVLSGEAGIGKTALAGWAGAQAARAGMSVALGRASEHDDAPPYLPWIDLLGELLHDETRARALGPLPTPFGAAPVGSAHQLREAVVAALLALAGATPVVLLLDDLHWADDASLALLRALCRAIADVPVLVVGTFRPEATGAGLAALLPQPTREAGARHLPLRRLTRDETAALVAARHPLPPMALADELYARTIGNPFFLLESLRDLRGDDLPERLPETIREVLEARFRRLTPGTLALLEVAALLGDPFDDALAGAALGYAPEDTLRALDEAQAAHLLRAAPGDAATAFAHPLIPHALRERLAPHRRHARHALIAATLRGWRGRDQGAAMLAAHLRAAGQGSAAVPHYLAAARRAVAIFAEREASDYYRAALACVAPDDAAGRARILLDLGWTLRHIDGTAARAGLDEALTAACRAGEEGLIGRAQARFGIVRKFAGEAVAGLALTRQGAERLARGTDDERAEAAGNWHSLALGYAELGRYAEAFAAVERSVDLHRALPAVLLPRWANPTARLRTILNVPLAMLGRPDEARRATALRRMVYYEIHDLKMVAATINDEIRAILLPYALGDWDAIDALLEEQARVCALVAVAVGTVEPPSGRVQACFLRGDWDEATRLLDDDAAWADPLAGHARVRALLRVELQRARGQRPDAAILWPILPDGVATAPGDGDFVTQLASLRLLAALAIDAGAYAQARDLLDAHERWLAWGGVAQGRAAGALARATLARAAGEPAAGRLAAAACDTARADGDHLTLCRALRFAGEVATGGRVLRSCWRAWPWRNDAACPMRPR